MSSRLPRRRGLVPWLVALALAAPLPAAALPFGDAGAALVSKLRAVLSSLWGRESNKANGYQMDPDGLYAPAAQAPNACEFDSNGVCSAVVRDNGCQVDPYGLCEN